MYIYLLSLMPFCVCVCSLVTGGQESHEGFLPLHEILFGYLWLANACVYEPVLWVMPTGNCDMVGSLSSY